MSQLNHKTKTLAGVVVASLLSHDIDSWPESDKNRVAESAAAVVSAFEQAGHGEEGNCGYQDSPCSVCDLLNWIDWYARVHLG